MANDDDKFDQPIHEEVQAGSKRKYSDRDDAGYVTSSEVEDFDFDFDMEDHKMNFHMWPDEESCGTMVLFLYLFEPYINSFGATDQ